MIRRYNLPWEQVLPSLKSNISDLAIVDPPYGIGEAGKNHKSRNTLVRQKDGVTMRRCPSTTYVGKDWDNQTPPDEYFKELQRVSKNQIIFGANYFPYINGGGYEKPPRRENFESFLYSHPTGWIIWDKCNGTNDFNDCEVIYTSFDFPSFVLPYMWNGMMQGRSIIQGRTIQGNKKLNQKRIHPTEKPIIIYRYLLQMFSVHGQLIGDSHGGSESLSIACDQENRDLIVMEKDLDIFQAATDRLNAYKIPYYTPLQFPKTTF